jgi:L-ribulose-5-phosphate 3-epimerase
MQLGMNLWTVYGWQLPERPCCQVLDSLADMGVRAIEMVVDEGANSVENLLAHQAEIQARLAGHGMVVPSVASALFWRYNLGSQDEGVRRHAVDIVAGMCQVAKAYGAGKVLVVAGLQEPHTPYIQTWNNAVRSLREAARTAEAEGVLIGVENVPCNFLLSPKEMVDFIAAVDHPHVGCYLDPGNAAAVFNSYPENWCTALAGRITGVHAKDYDHKARRFVNCGQGDLDWAQLLTLLSQGGYDDYVLVETPPERMGDIQEGLKAAQQSLAGMRHALDAATVH